jgi:hypothetical protein
VAHTVDFRSAESTTSVSVSAFIDFLRTLNDTLHYALAFYLIGCENTRYFLVEYYKAVEVIENTLGGERSCIDLLGPFGVDKATLKTFRGECNDMLRAPVDIGRHAPAPTAPLYAVDLRNLLSEPRSRSLFETSTRACRQVIDGYMEFSSRRPNQRLYGAVAPIVCARIVARASSQALCRVDPISLVCAGIRHWRIVTADAIR